MRITLLSYGFATTIGFIHAQAYYGVFDIDILNYADPIDLLFISLEHIDQVLIVTLLIVPIVLIWVALGLPALAIVCFSFLAAFALVASLIFLLFSAMIPLGVGTVINGGRSLFIDRGGPGDAPTVEGGEDGAASGERTGEGEGSTARAGEVPRYELTEGGAVEAEAPANVRTVVMVVGDPARPEYAGEDWLPRCDMKFAAWVGPFAEGAHDIGSDLDKDGECFKTVKRLNVEKYPNEGIVGVSQWWRRAESEDVQRLILVGRADREPISNDIHFSNFSLAQSRANWVKEQLSKAGTRELHVLSIPSGPTTPHKVDPCDRVVEIHMCSGPPDIGNTGADNSGANDEDRQGAGGGVEERP